MKLGSRLFVNSTSFFTYKTSFKNEGIFYNHMESLDIIVGSTREILLNQIIQYHLVVRAILTQT
jgi:hypothetical protein